MASKSSDSLVEAANQYFDALVKSRFIEMFGTIDLSAQLPEWSEIKTIGIVLTGSTPKTNVSEFWDGEYLWITPAELSTEQKYYGNTERKITVLGLKSCSLDQIDPGTVLLTSRAPIGKVGIATETMFCNQGFKNIKCSESINPEYLYTLLLYNTEYLNSLGRGATFKEISRKIVESIRIPVPPIELQNQFADFVRQVDKSKLLFQQMVSRYDELVKSRFIEMFGDPLLNPMKWKTKTLDEITVKIRNGTTPVGSKKVYTKDGVIFLQSQNVWRNKIDYSDTQFISYELNQKMIDTQLEIGDVLITKTGRINTEKSSLGRVSLFRGNSLPVNISSEVYLVRVTDEINSEFLMHLLLMESYQRYIRACSPGGTDKRHLYLRYVEKFIIIQPPLNLQNQFAEFIRQVDKSKSEILEGIKKLSAPQNN